MRLTVGGHSATAWNTPASSTQPFCLRPCLLSVRTALFGQFGSNEMVTGLAAMIACRAADSLGDFTTLASDSSGVIPMATPLVGGKKGPLVRFPWGSLDSRRSKRGGRCCTHFTTSAQIMVGGTRAVAWRCWWHRQGLGGGHHRAADPPSARLWPSPPP